MWCPALTMADVSQAYEGNEHGSIASAARAVCSRPSLILALVLTFVLLALEFVMSDEAARLLAIGSVFPAVLWAWNFSVRGALVIGSAFALLNGSAATLLHAEPALDWLADGGAPGSLAIFGVVVVVAWLSGTRRALERELSARLEAQREIERLSQQRASILSSAGEGIIAIDADGRISAVNPAVERMAGVAASEIVGQPVGDLIRLPSDVSATGGAWAEHLDQALASDAHLVAERGVVSPRWGRDTIVDCVLSPLRDSDTGESLGAVMTTRDVTERVELERARSEFLAITSHELRTPLTAIHGAVKLVAAGAVGPVGGKVRELIEIASKNSDRVLRLVDQIIDLERLSLGQLDLKISECCPRELAEEASSALAPIAAISGVEIVLDGRGDVPNFDGDHDRLIQVLMNVVGNAVKFSPEGASVVIGFEAIDDGVRFDVRDKGRGIAPEHAQHIFEPFAQVEERDATGLGGSGLGLAIARGIVARHGGRIWVESELGAGTTASFQVPRRQNAA